MEEKYVSDNEILEFAIGREVDAYHFYNALACRVDDPHIHQVIEDLAKEELDHKERLEFEVLKTGHVLAIGKGIPKPTRDNYIQSDSDLSFDMDYRDILLLGIEKEEAAFRVYVNLIPNVYDEDSRETLLAIAQEEVRHKYRFEAELERLQKKT